MWADRRLDLQDWALQDLNTPAESREKPRVSTRGAAESAANRADSPPETPSAEAPESRHDATDTPDAGPVGEHFAEAVAVLARLPLTDAERAEAVRRLLAGKDARRDPSRWAGRNPADPG